MTKFTKLWRLMMILLISSSVLIVQAQKDVSTGKANAKSELKKEILQQYTQEQINIIEQSGFTEDVLSNGKEPDGDLLIKMLEVEGFDFSSAYEASFYKEDPTDVVGTYTFSQAIETYTEITGGTVLGSTTSDDQRFVDPAVPLGGTTTTGVGFPIGFNFTFDGIVFDRIAINNNGWVSLGQSTLTPAVNNASTSAYTPIGSTTAITPDDLVSRLVGFGRDLQGQTGSELRIQTIGTTPNQECVIQWKGYKKYGSGGTGDNYNFQIRLLETSNVVKFVYGVFTNGATSNTIQVGLRAAPSATATNWANRTTTTDWSATSSGGSNTATCAISSTVYPANGLTYIYTPPVVGTPLPPTNPNPANGATGVAVNGNLTWDFGTNSVTYDLWFGPAGSMTQVVTGAAAGTSGSYTYSGIAYASPYQWQVIEYNGALNTPGPIWGFTTTCETYLPPYNEDFTAYLGVAPPPICWQEADAGDPTTGPNTFGTSLWVNDNFGNITGSSNCAKVNMYSNTMRDWLISPHFDLSSGSFEVRYDFAVTNWNGTNPILMGSDDQMMFLISPDGGFTWSTLITYDASTTYSNTGQTEIVNLSAYNQSDVMFAFWSNEGTVNDTPDYDFFIDNFKVQIPPTCPEPSGLTVDNISGNIADLGWTENGSATTWNIEFGAAGFVPTGTPTHPGITANPYNMTGLSPQTSYDFYVQAVCGVGDLSVWVGPKTFTSACASFVAPFSEDFVVWPPVCWDLTGGTYSWVQYTTGVLCAKANFWSQTSGNTDIMTTNTIDVSGLANPALEFYWSHYYNSTYPNDTLKVLVSDDNGSTWAQVWMLGNINFNSNDGATNTTPGTFVSSGVIDLSAFGDLILVRFFGLSGYGPDCFIDDVAVFQPLANDVGGLTIDLPAIVEVGTVNPIATVKNFGYNPQTFNVQMTIGAYTSTKTVTALSPYTSVQVTFDPWNATLGDYTVQVCTQLAGDMNTANDCISNPVSVQVLRKIYGYNANTDQICYFYVQYPGVITNIAASTSDQFIGAGTWANGIWYGSEYYDATLLSGGGWWTIDPETGVMTKLGDFDKGFAGISYNPASGIMYGTFWTGTTNELYTIDPATGAFTLIGSYGTSLMINLASDGTNFLYAIGISDDILYQIDPSVPSATAIGATGYAFNYAQDMEYDFENDIMYAAGYHTTGELMTVNLTTGACTSLGAFQGGAEITGMAIPYVSGYRIYGNVYYGDLNDSKPQATQTTVTLTPGSTISTGIGGTYEFTALEDGTYQLIGASTKAWGGLNSPDPSFAQQYILGTRVLTNLQKRSADVNLSGTIQSLDVTMMKRRILGQTYTSWVKPTEMVWDGPLVPGWHGVSPTWIQTGLSVPVSGADVNQNVRCLFTGDVNELYTPLPNP